MSQTEASDRMGSRRRSEWLQRRGLAFSVQEEVRAANMDVRHAPAWDLVEKTLGIRRRVQGKRVVFEGYRTVDGELPSLRDLVRHCRGELVLHFDDQLHPELAKRAQHLIRVKSVGKLVTHFIAQERFYIPSEPVMANLTAWAKHLAEGSVSTLTSFVCPDWATKNGRYTFEGVNDGLGLVSQRLVEFLPGLWKMFREAGHVLPVVVIINDFEGCGADNLARAGNITFAEFQNRCRGSQQKLRDLLIGNGILDSYLSTPLASELVNEHAWAGLNTEAKVKLEAQGATMALGISDTAFRDIVKARMSLLRRWNPKADETLFTQRVTAQMAEYGALGSVAGSLPNSLMVQADAVAMAPGFRLLQTTLPVLHRRADDY